MRIADKIDGTEMCNTIDFIERNIFMINKKTSGLTIFENDSIIIRSKILVDERSHLFYFAHTHITISVKEP